MGTANVINYAPVLKEIYLPLWGELLNIEPSPIMDKIKKVELEGETIVASAPIGLNGGFGMSTEAGSTPKSGHQMAKRFETSPKMGLVTIQISDKATRLVAKDNQTMMKALETEVKGSYKTAKWNMSRQLFGNGTGILTTISALGVAGNTVTVANVAYLKEGLIVDFYATGDAVGATPAVAARRILAIDRAAKTILIDGAATTLAAGFITVQNSYGLEYTGLGSIFDDTVLTLYGVTKSTSPWIKPITYDAGKDLYNSKIWDVLSDAELVKNSNIDMLMMGRDAYKDYVDYLSTNNIRNEASDLTLKGGFKSIQFTYNNRVVDIVFDPMVPAAEMWGFDTSTLELHQTPWDFAAKDGGAFTRVPGTTVYESVIVSYGDLICTNPGGCVRLYNIV